MTVVCVRHGETEWSRTHRHTGRTDISLTDAGREQALMAGRRITEWDFARVLCSPLARARETAALAGFAEPELDDDLMEWDYGDAEGRTREEIGAGWNIWRDGPAGGETLAAFAARADRVVERLQAVDGDVLVFAHGHFLRVLGARWIGAPPELAERLLLSTAAICELRVMGGNRVIGRWNT